MRVALRGWFLCGFLGLLNAAVGCASSPPRATPAPTASPEDARQYYPLEMGWRWAYDVQKAGQAILAIYAVTDRSGAQVTLQAGEERIVYAVLPEGIARRAPSKETPVGDFLLKSPVRAGASWPIDGGTATVAAVDKTVDVPAGRYQGCAIVEENRNDPPRLVRTTYAPGVGPISIEYLVHDPASGRFDPALTAALRGATPPGQDPLGAAQER